MLETRNNIDLLETRNKDGSPLKKVPPTKEKNWNNEPCGRKDCEICYPTQTWQEEFSKKWHEGMDYEEIVLFISAQKELSYKEGQKDPCYSVSVWKEVGQKRGYDKFFEKKAFEEGVKSEKERMIKWCRKQWKDGAVLPEDLLKLLIQ